MTLQNGSGAEPVDDARLVLVAPPPRCGETWGTSAARICGEIARFTGRRPGEDQLRFFCEMHRPRASWEISGQQAYRRVCLTVQVYIGATEHSSSSGLGEAYDAVARSLSRLGAHTNIVAVTAETVKASFPLVRGDKRMARVRAE